MVKHDETYIVCRLRWNRLAAYKITELQPKGAVEIFRITAGSRGEALREYRKRYMRENAKH